MSSNGFDASEKMAGILNSAVAQTKDLNAEPVTAIAAGFLKRVGHKGGLKLKRVTLGEETYNVEVEMKKLSALVRVDSKMHEIEEYESQTKGEEAPTLPLSPKGLLLVFVVSYFLFKPSEYDCAVRSVCTTTIRASKK